MREILSVPAALLLIAILIMSSAANAADVNYAESVAMTGHAEDASMSFDVRLARFPGKSSGTLWFYVFVDGKTYALVNDHALLSHSKITDVAAEDAAFEVHGEPAAKLSGAKLSEAKLSGTNRYTAAMTGHLLARGTLQESADPEPGPGTIPVEIEAEFSADHTPIRVRPGRLEVMGRALGTVHIDETAYPFDIPAKWHEQTGERTQFAPAFTYLFVQGKGRGIMATKHAAGAWGYVYEEAGITAVTALNISPYGRPSRDFEATLEDGRLVSGTASVVREVSVPIEGRRRPGATVIVTSDIGRLVGVLNDWDPASRTYP